MVSLGAFANLPTEALAKRTLASMTTARRWKRLKKAPAGILRLLELTEYGDLEHISPAWKGWTIRRGKLVAPCGWEFPANEVLTVPVLHSQIASFQSKFERIREWLERKPMRFSINVEMAVGAMPSIGLVTDNGTSASLMSPSHPAALSFFDFDARPLLAAIDSDVSSDNKGD